MGRLMLSCPDFSVLSNLDSLAGNGENIRRGRKRYNRWAPLSSPDSLHCFTFSLTSKPGPRLFNLRSGEKKKIAWSQVTGYLSPIQVPLRLRVSFSAHKLWDGVFVKPLFFLRSRSPKSGTQSIGQYMWWDTNWHKLFSDSAPVISHRPRKVKITSSPRAKNMKGCRLSRATSLPVIISA